MHIPISKFTMVYLNHGLVLKNHQVRNLISPNFNPNFIRSLNDFQFIQAGVNIQVAVRHAVRVNILELGIALAESAHAQLWST